MSDQLADVIDADSFVRDSVTEGDDPDRDRNDPDRCLNRCGRRQGRSGIGT
jgi:hypothetical protein